MKQEQITISLQKGEIRRRSDINNDFQWIKEKIRQLREDLVKLKKEDYLLSDEGQWFTELEEEEIISRRPKRTETNLIGRIHWNEEFKCDDTGEIFYVERSRIVRVNGEWL